MCKSIVTVGDVINARLNKLGWDIYDLAYQMGMTNYINSIQRIIDGKERIDEYMAKRLSAALHIFPEFWLALDAHNYRQKGKERFLKRSQRAGQAVFAFC